MRRPVIPVAIAIGVGLVVLLHLFITNRYLDAVGGALVEWASFVAAFAVLLGLVNVLLVHGLRIAHRDGNSWSSAVILVSALVVFVVTLPSGGAGPASAWVFRFVYQPLEASFLALMVFFIASAGSRALRARTWENALFLLAALIVLIGAIPASGLLSPLLPAAKEWILQVPTIAGIRGILIGVALGVLATGLRLLGGIDRPYTDQ